MRRRLATRVALAAAGSAALAAAGCGSSSSEVSATGGSNASSPPPPGSTSAQASSAPTSTSTAPATTPSTGGTPAGTGGTPASARVHCASIGFAPASSHGAFEILAINTTCPTAQAVASVAKGCFGCGYAAAGFACRGRKITTGLIRVAYTCTKASARITFIRG